VGGPPPPPRHQRCRQPPTTSSSGEGTWSIISDGDGMQVQTNSNGSTGRRSGRSEWSVTWCACGWTCSWSGYGCDADPSKPREWLQSPFRTTGSPTSCKIAQNPIVPCLLCLGKGTGSGQPAGFSGQVRRVRVRVAGQSFSRPETRGLPPGTRWRAKISVKHQ
jgi:hypothetical protein